MYTKLPTEFFCKEARVWCGGRGKKWIEKKTYLAFAIFFPRVEFGAFVHIIAAGGAADTHGKHRARRDRMILGLLAPRDFGWIKIRRIVFVQHFSFSHPACLSLTNPTSKTRTAMHLLLLLRLLLLLLLLVCFRALKAKFLLSHTTLIKHHPHAK